MIPTKALDYYRHWEQIPTKSKLDNPEYKHSILQGQERLRRYMHLCLFLSGPSQSLRDAHVRQPTETFTNLNIIVLLSIECIHSSNNRM
jgi:hypothetical protein